MIQLQPSVPPGLIDVTLRASGAPVRIFEAWHDDGWPSVDELSGLVVMGGTMNVDQTSEYPFLAAARALMANAIEQDRPTLGVCLGSQMMARVLGTEVRRAEQRNALFSRIDLTPDGKDDPLTSLFDGLEVLQFHEDTFETPPEAVALATSAITGLVQAFRFGETAYAIQFHFEVDEPILRGWTDNIGARDMRTEWGADPSDLLKRARAALGPQAAAGTRLVEEFLRLIKGMQDT